MRTAILFAILGLAFCVLPNQRPIIGIYTQSIDSNEPTSEMPEATLHATFNESYIAASYVKFVEMSGAQVVPIYAYSNKSYFDTLLPKLNGVLFTGGDVDIDIRYKWTQNADYILKYAISQNDKGNVFPIWGTCLGMQLLAYLTSGYDLKAIAPVRGQVAVRNTISVQPESVTYGDLSTNLLNRLQSGDGILYFNHHFAITKEYFLNNQLLRKFWNVDSYTTTSYSEDFLSTFNAKNYPFFGVQFHPEKNLFEWKVYADRSESGAEIVQIISNRFVEVARKNKNSFSSDQEFFSQSIHNTKPSPTTMSFLRIYVFSEDTHDIPSQLTAEQ